MEWKMSNEDVSVGEIFVYGHTDEVGHYSTFYKVVEKRGKSIVIIRQVAAEATGEKEPNGIRVRALPDEITGDERRVRAYIENDGTTVLGDINNRFRRYYYSGDTSCRTGWYASGVKKGRVSNSLLEEVLPL